MSTTISLVISVLNVYKNTKNKLNSCSFKSKWKEGRKKRGKVKWRTRKGEDIRRACCLCWLSDSTAVPCVCVGCALNLCQLINPALLHSPQALSTVSATLHNHPTRGWEVQSGPAGRATLVLGTRPPLTPLQLCLQLDMQRRDEKLAPATFLPCLRHSCLFILDWQWLQTLFYHSTPLY